MATSKDGAVQNASNIEDQSKWIIDIRARWAHIRAPMAYECADEMELDKNGSSLDVQLETLRNNSINKVHTFNFS